MAIFKKSGNYIFLKKIMDKNYLVKKLFLNSLSQNINSPKELYSLTTWLNDNSSWQS